jgi:hypothetical protein
MKRTTEILSSYVDEWFLQCNTAIGDDSNFVATSFEAELGTALENIEDLVVTAMHIERG